MHLRYLKIMFAAITSLMALIYVTQNVANPEAAHRAIIYVMSGADHTVYTNSFAPQFSDPLLGWVVVCVIFALEYAAGLLLARGYGTCGMRETPTQLLLTNPRNGHRLAVVLVFLSGLVYLA